MRINKKIMSILLITAAATFSACQKEIENLEPDPPTTDPVDQPPSAADRINDTTLAYSRDIYLWYNQIPATFDARAYDDPADIMTAIRTFSTEPGFSNPVDRWSFAMKQEEWDDASSGISGNLGFNVFFLAEGDLRVTSVERNSPAGLAGVRRGWQITEINGNTNITTGNANFIVQAVWGSASSSFKFKKPDGSFADLSLNAATYQQDPIYLDTVYTEGTKKVGYIVFNSFLGDTSQIYNSFTRIFNRFSQENVNEVIVDLRYNGGGYVSVQDRLANYLVTSAANGGVMMNQEFNNKYAQLNSTTRFNKIGNLNLSRIFFIVSSSTASASELLINNLEPVMDVKVVGPEPTYGKPVGYFPIPVGDWYIFPVSFRSTNRVNQGNYFNGIQTDAQVADGISRDWGDRQEASLGSIIRFISTGSFSVVGEIPGSRSGVSGRDAQIRQVNLRFDAPRFKGAIDTRKLR